MAVDGVHCVWGPYRLYVCLCVTVQNSVSSSPSPFNVMLGLSVMLHVTQSLRDTWMYVAAGTV